MTGVHAKRPALSPCLQALRAADPLIAWKLDRSEQINHARKLLNKGEARQYVADLLNEGRSTIYRALKCQRPSLPSTDLNPRP